MCREVNNHGTENSNFYKIEMDDSNFWELDKSKWANYCLEFLYTFEHLKRRLSNI